MLKFDTLISSVENHLQTFITSWPNSLARDFRKYNRRFKIYKGGAESNNPKYYEYPFWLILPGWLLNRYGFNLKPHTGQFLKDILWVQYCLFFFIRIQDDLFDIPTENTSLIFASNLFLLEAENTLSRYFNSAPDFWKIYRDSLSESTRAIVETANMQHSYKTSLRKLLSYYARIATHFNIGIAAICIKCNRIKDLPQLARFTAEMVMAGQLIDDLEDIEEDLKGGKYNYVAIQLLRQYGKSLISESKMIEVIRRAILVTDGIGMVYREVRRHLVLAGQAIEEVGIPEGHRLVKKYHQGMNKMQNNFHQSRVKFFFKGV